MEDQFFDFAAEVSLTKHLESVASTEKLVEHCHIEKGRVILDVGWSPGSRKT